jgi:hypothetical protein
MISPPEELQDYLDVDPDVGFILKPGAPDSVQAFFKSWTVELEEARALGINF